MAAVIAENYQLKWHSHTSHLHSSIATLYRSDNFTDVTLVTGDGRYLSAHRFILSACSSYLNRVLQIATSGGVHLPNSSIVIALPPEVSYRTLTILLQYMYSGEATVSNEQLNGVLRAGEILRIKGLCHNGKEKRAHQQIAQPQTQQDPSHETPPSRPGSSSTDRLTLNNFLPTSKTPEACNQSSSTALRKSMTSSSSSCSSLSVQQNSKPLIPKTDKTDDLKNKHNANHDILEKTPKNRIVLKDNNIEVTSSGEPGEILIEDSMKIELLVKEEPLDWDDEEATGSHDEIDHDYNVKSERYSSQNCDENMYAPLTCDLCQETFTSPSLWVRHIETHPITDVTHKRRKRNLEEDDVEEEEEFPLLRCELCQQVFTSPGEWVRHIQNSHTEEQLALNNSSRNIRKTARISCPSCNKTFPSVASMLIHSRTHTGEKPYVCCVCEKGFNVKSNLLRHLRTLHDHLMSPGNQYHSLLKEP